MVLSSAEDYRTVYWTRWDVLVYLDDFTLLLVWQQCRCRYELTFSTYSIMVLMILKSLKNPQVKNASGLVQNGKRLAVVRPVARLLRLPGFNS